tara:strand:- start:3021 stop:4280 length:1260 start_codon:yes stop_codon:yes gene_type:complete
MNSCVIFFSQSYINFGSHEALSWLSSTSETVLILHKEEKINATLKPYIKNTHYINGTINASIRPAFNKNEIIDLVSFYMEKYGSPNNLRIFCQQEDNVELAAQVREFFNIPGDKPYMISGFRDKILMKKRVSNCKLGVVPKHVQLDNKNLSGDYNRDYAHLCKMLGEKFVIKPISAAGSFNVCIVETYRDFLEAANLIENKSYSYRYEADEFVDGTLYQCDSFIIDGEIFYCGILELGCTNFDFVGGKPLSVFPVTSKPTYEKLYDFNKEVINCLGFTNGSTHHEIFVKKDGSLVFLEIAARVPGGLGVPYHIANSNINLIDANIYLMMGCDLNKKINLNIKNNVISALLPVGRGKIKSLNEPPIISNYTIDWYVHKGMLVDSRSLADAAGVLMAFNDDQLALRNDFDSLQNYVPITCE